MLTVTERAWLRLHLTRGLGRLGLLHLLAAYGSPEEILCHPVSEWPQPPGCRRLALLQVPAENDPYLLEVTATLADSGIRIIGFNDPDYPPQLRTIHDPPALLYQRGCPIEGEALAVVGARNASDSGKFLTREICTDIASRDITIISGLARGIDSAAHRAALAAGGTTIAVLGCGIDLVYPLENTALAKQIIEQGTLLSEYAPGTPPLAGNFPGRNRIISALSCGVLIVEATEKSGSLITADFALEHGREVFAIPGAVTAANSGGVNSLLKQGAHLVTEARDILDILWPEHATARPNPANNPEISFSEQEVGIIRLLSFEPQHIDDLARKSGLTPIELSVTLLQLELRGGLTQLPGMRYIRASRI
jgi:DNA processing protein